MKKLRLIILFIVVLALALSLYFLTRDENVENKEEIGETTYFTVKTVEEDISEISLVNTSGVFGFEKKNGEWMNIFTEYVKTSGNTIYGIESIIRETYAVDEIEKDVASMAKYGLDKPVATAKYVTAGGNAGFIKIGNSIVGAKHYFTLDDKNVYTMDISEAGLFLVGMRAFADMTLIDEEISEISSVTIFSSGENVTVSKKSEEELKEESADALFSYGLISPVKENASPNDVQHLFEMLANTVATEYDPYASDEECGFTESGKYFSYTAKDSSGKFIVGNKTSDGDFYVKPEGKKGAYKVSKEELAFMDYTAFDLVDKHIALYYFDEVSKVTIEAHGEKYELVTGDTPTISGKALELEAAQEFYRNLISLTYQGNVEKEIDTDVSEVIITFHTADGKDVTRYIKYDAMNYAVLRNGEMEFTIQKKYVEKILSLIKEL
ncbi:MAG: DUF4340 domain-containing protein [Clostridia bacterium]|nr:DUF4340 domain-containing protein [Clostridia bacterium]